MTARRPVIFWVRRVHRWVSLAFVPIAAVLILGSAALGEAAVAVLSAAAISLLALLLASGAWIAVQFYTAPLRRARRAA